MGAPTTETAIDIASADQDRHDRAFLGHPRALGYLAFAEAWERFSYYGMNALLGLYMAKQLLLPGHVENIAGFPQFHRFLEGLYGGQQMTVVAAATATVGLYGTLVYITPTLGGLLADSLLGRTRTITLGALLMAAGHFLMAFEQSFLLALLCLVLGSGCFKGNIATQVGSLYGPGDLRRADAFQIFYLGINGGVIAAPLIVGTLGETVGWHWGFGAAGVGMLVGLTIYLAGRKWLPAPVARSAKTKAHRPAFGRREAAALALLAALLPVLAVGAVGNQEIFNAYMLWADAHLDLTFFGHKVPTTWLQTLDSITSVSFLAGMVVFWRVWARRFPEPDELSKITIGLFISVFGVLCLAAGAASEAVAGHKVSIWWAVAFHLINSIGFANVFPVSLALYARSSPQIVAGTVIGIFYFHLAGANALTGKLGGLLDKMPGAQFWMLHAGLVAAAGVVFLLVKLFLGRLLKPVDEPVAAAD